MVSRKSEWSDDLISQEQQLDSSFGVRYCCFAVNDRRVDFTESSSSRVHGAESIVSVVGILPTQLVVFFHPVSRQQCYRSCRRIDSLPVYGSVSEPIQPHQASAHTLYNTTVTLPPIDSRLSVIVLLVRSSLHFFVVAWISETNLR